MKSTESTALDKEVIIIAQIKTLVVLLSGTSNNINSINDNNYYY